MDIWGMVEKPLAWIESHEAVIAWSVGWLASISTAQFVKRIAAGALRSETVQRIVQVTAVMVGAAVAFMLWPKVSANRLTFALVVGMSSPLAYSWGVALLSWKWPEVAKRASVAHMVETKQGTEPKS